MKYPVVEQKIIVISEEPEIPPKIPTKTKIPRNYKIVKTTQATNNPKAVHKGTISETIWTFISILCHIQVINFQKESFVYNFIILYCW